jgi:hypothetical protein
MKLWCMDADSVTGYSEGQATPVERTGSSILPTRTNFRPSTRRHGSSETEVVSPAKQPGQRTQPERGQCTPALMGRLGHKTHGSKVPARNARAPFLPANLTPRV